MKRNVAYKPVHIAGTPAFGYVVGDDGTVLSHKTWKLLKPWLTDGYPSVALRINGETVNAYIHRLVAEAFIGPCPEGMEVCHYDGNRRNPSADNLRYDTRKNNLADRVRHGTDQRGERNPAVKLTETQVASIRQLRADGVLLRIIAAQFGVRESTVSRIINGVRRA